MSILNDVLRKFVNYSNRRRLKNENFSLIASDCTGGCILSDLGLRFNSPFVNLWMYPQDFIKYCSDIPHYLEQSLEFHENDEKLIDGKYPVGDLDGLKIFFQHYSSKSEAKIFWEKRSKRISLNNLFVMANDRSYTNDDFKEFDALPIRNKIVFTHLPLENIKSSFYIPGFENERCVSLLMRFRNQYSGHKLYDYFDYVSFFNRNV